MSLLVDRRDLAFVLYEWLGVEALTKRALYAAHDREIFDAVLELSEALACEKFAPHNKRGDSNEPRFDGKRVHIIPEVQEAVAAYAAAGLIGAGMLARHGGMQLPTVIEKACSALFMAANPGSFSYVGLTSAAANLLASHGGQDQIDRFLPPMIEGRFLATMCLSEPQAGSSLADVTTRAEPQEDGAYRLFGTKMWISAGEHDLSETIIHFVLAKAAGGPAGAKGLSLFLVPRDLVNQAGEVGARNDVSMAGLNHKMGFRGTTNCVLDFGVGFTHPAGRPGAIGYLVGELHNGLACMFTMMNEARIGVGMSAAAIGYAGYLHALEYARTRPQGRLDSNRDPSSPQVPIIEHADVRRMLLAQKAYVQAGLAFNLYCASLVDESRSAESEQARADAVLLLDLLTPVAKSWPSQWCLAANDLAIQVHGGYGYTRDFNVEQFYRDNRLNPIHEGTHGIHARDLLGRKVSMKGGAALDLFGAVVTRSIVRAEETRDTELRHHARQLSEALQRLVSITRTLHGGAGMEIALANASLYLEAFGHIAMTWIWLEQALAAHGKPGDFYDGKLLAARYFVRWETPKVSAMLDLLERADRTVFDAGAELF